MTPDIYFWYLPKYVTHTKILAHVCDHVRRFYGNCRTLNLNQGFVKILNSSNYNKSDNKISPEKTKIVNIGMLVSPLLSEKNQDCEKHVKYTIQEKFFCINRCPKKMHYKNFENIITGIQFDNK